MRLIALIGLLALLGSPAFAQAPDQTPPEGAAATPRRGLPLNAMRHHQPRRADVERREGKRRDEPTTGRAQRNPVDDLYDEVMKQSAPAHPQ